ncbi:hypothetical protein HLB23_20375 [Nocardia uniformis]|uniref:Peptidase MA-like domain-containing protein n=1 Tax=Nocardia uniformis TaxID=53432 RepID=A0A849C0P5_9NOCA|nr:hypothetical protein [Nocardia uniformis]NNH72184.1 hypothetical protein [Nocardia uniformis]
MSALRQVRGWLGTRRRFQFVITVATVVTALTAACCALIMLPTSAVPKLRAVAPAASAPQAGVIDDPQLPGLLRSMESYGEVITETIGTGTGRAGIVLGHNAYRADIEVLAGELAAATAAVTALWGSDWSQRPVVVIASSPSEFASLTHAVGDVPTEVAAATVADPFHPGARPTGQRVVFGPEAGRRLGPDGLRAVLRHELTHIATRAATVDGSPQWMLEGFAEYAAHRAGHRPATEIAPTLTARARATDLPRDLPADDLFAPTSGEAALAYEQSWSACAFIADEFGEPALVNLYRALATGPRDTAAVNTVVRDTLGIPREAFLARWRSWIVARTSPGA